MAKNNIPNKDADPTEVYRGIADMSFLPKKAKDINEGREFPVIKKGERLFRLIYACLMEAGAISFLVCLFYFGGPDHNLVRFSSSNGNGGYGYFGLIVTALLAIAFLAQQVYSFFYDTKLTLVEDPKKNHVYKAISTCFYYLELVLLYGAYTTTFLRQSVLYQTDPFSALPYTGIILFVIVAVIAVVGVLFAFLDKPTLSKVYNAFVLGLVLYLIFGYSSILTYARSLTNAGIGLLIGGALVADVSLIFYCLEKKPGYRSAFQVVYTFLFVFQFIAILYYGMMSATPI